MLKLNELSSPRGARKRKKIVGRGSGSGHGKTSCRGHKGQTSRTGKGKRFGFEGGQMPLIRRIPKRGFTSIFKQRFQVVNVDALNACKDGDVVTPQSLREMGLIRKAREPVKILGGGKLAKKITVKAHRFSQTAAQAIEALGGKAERIHAQNSQSTAQRV